MTPLSELATSYNASLVLLSVVIAIVSAFVALAAVPRINDSFADSKRTIVWSLVFGLSLGAGIWTMHFIAMLALNLSVAVNYNIGLTLISLLVAVCFSTLGILPLRGGGALKGMRLLGIGSLMGIGIAGMHYTGMASMQLAASMSYDYVWLAVSVIIAVVASSAALWIANHLRTSDVFGEIPVKLSAALVMGLAVSSMHYSGMAAVHFFALPIQGEPLSGIDTHLMIMVLTVIAGLIQCGVLVTAALDQSAMAGWRLKHSEENQRLLLNLLPNGVIVHEQGVIVYANPSACRMLGLEDSGLTERKIMDFIHPDSQKMVTDRIQHVMQTHTEAPQTEELLLRTDGSSFIAEAITMPMTWNSRSVIQVVFNDISKRKQSEEEINRLGAIIEQTSDFVGLATIEGHVLYVNSAGLKMLGFPHDSVPTDLTLKDFHSEKTVTRLFSNTLPRTEKEGNVYTECDFLHQDGHDIPTSAVFSAHRNSNGILTHYSVIARDLTEERKRNQQIEHTQRLESMGILAGGIAHDFNNILTAIMGNAAIAERKAISHPDEMPKYLNNIVESSEKAAHLCKQMLAYSGKGKFVVKPINLSNMVNEITNLLEVSITKNVVLKYQLVDNLPAVEADIAQMQQVIMNLVINASEAIENKSGVICISTGVINLDQSYLQDTSINIDVQEGRYVFLEVSDTGIGMDAQTQQRIFEPFFTTKFTGRGLGMSAVLGIIRGHHGTMKVYSELNRGTTFKILLPISNQKPEKIGPIQTISKQWQGSGAVLIVDDEEAIRETAAMMLEDMGFSILTAENGLDGVEVYRKHQHDISAVLLDMSMPKLDGQGCFQELRRINKNVKVVLSSGYNEQDATSRFTGKGLAGFVQKPYLPQALENIMRQLIESNH